MNYYNKLFISQVEPFILFFFVYFIFGYLYFNARSLNSIYDQWINVIKI